MNVDNIFFTFLGSVMIVLMKAISVIFEMENGVVEVPSNTLQFYSYVFNPASVIFGPFITYKNYMQMFKAYSMVSINHTSLASFLY